MMNNYRKENGEREWACQTEAPRQESAHTMCGGSPNSYCPWRWRARCRVEREEMEYLVRYLSLRALWAMFNLQARGFQTVGCFLLMKSLC